MMNELMDLGRGSCLTISIHNIFSGIITIQICTISILFPLSGVFGGLSIIKIAEKVFRQRRPWWIYGPD